LLIAPVLSFSWNQLLPFVFIQLSSFFGPEFSWITIWLYLPRLSFSSRLQQEGGLLLSGLSGLIRLSKLLLSSASLHLSSFEATFKQELSSFQLAPSII
tara:strand:+ start:1226 stop:1522 length:297 start_codon:yes stop_codon:yes gene_type:complete